MSPKILQPSKRMNFLAKKVGNKRSNNAGDQCSYCRSDSTETVYQNYVEQNIQGNIDKTEIGQINCLVMVKNKSGKQFIQCEKKIAGCKPGYKS